MESDLPSKYIDEKINISETKAYEHKCDIKINKIINPTNKELKYLWLWDHK